MNIENLDVKFFQSMAHSPIYNYAVAGITSSIIGMPSENGVVRLLHSEREHQESVTPHSHRFDFHCIVLRGNVKNRIWSKSYGSMQSDLYTETQLIYAGSAGKYDKGESNNSRWNYCDYDYSAGQSYSMKANEVHSIFFYRGALVLIFEGKTVSDKSVILEPISQGRTIPILEVKPWMFQRAMPD